MLKRHWLLISRVERVTDSLLVAIAFFLSYHLREPILTALQGHFQLLSGAVRYLAPIHEYYLVLAAGALFFNGALSVFGAYRSMRRSSLKDLFRICLLSSGGVFLGLSAVLYLFKLDLSRSFLITFCALTGILLFIERAVVLSALRYYRVRGKNFRNVLIVGTGAQATFFAGEVAKQPELGVRIVGYVSFTEEMVGQLVRAPQGVQPTVFHLNARVVASPRTFEAALKSHAVDEVIFTETVKHFELSQELAAIAVEEGVVASFAADLFSLELVRSELSYFTGIPLLQYQPSPGDSSALVMKRLVDIGVSAVGLLVLAPIFAVVAASIKLDSKGPVFFRQQRVGLNGRLFTLLKFRSMVQDAETRLGELRGQNEMRGPVFKLANDPRITRVGAFLRRFSIDELPQLINVLKGDMSLVGPRPPLPEEVAQYQRRQRRRLSMRPGLTCIWQVSGRNDIHDFNEWAALDLEYIDNWSLTADLKLLLRTIPAVIRGNGAR